MDAFDRYWQWANKPPESTLTTPADIHHAIVGASQLLQLSNYHGT